MHRHLDLAERGDQADLLRPEDGPALDDDGARVDVLAAHPDVRALGDRSDSHAAAVELGHDLLRIDGVGAPRHRGASHDPDGLAGRQRAVEHGAGRQVGDDPKIARPGGGDVGAPDGVTVHRRVVGRRHVERRPHILGDDATERLAQREELGRGAAGDLGEDPILAILHRNHGAIIRTYLARASEASELI